MYPYDKIGIINKTRSELTKPDGIQVQVLFSMHYIRLERIEKTK